MKKIIKTVLAIYIIFSTSACSEWLELEPEDGVIRQEFWKTKEEAKSALSGCYAAMMEEDMMLSYFIWGEMRADFVTPGPKATSDLIAIRDGEIVASNEYTQWELFYKTINQCNTVIELAPLAKQKDLSFSDELLKQYIAEATCIRSLMYFYLVRTFRDVPYVTSASIYDNQDYSPAKMSQKEILEHLVTDLTSVENDLPFTYNTIAQSKGRFTRWGLKALLADIYFWQENYASCSDLCSQIINSGQFSLLPIRKDETTAMNENGENVPVYIANSNDAKELFNKMYVEGNCVESIFELQFGSDKGNPFVKWFKPVTGYLNAKTDEIRGFFPSSDLSREWRDIRSDFAWKNESVWKWIGLSADGPIYRADNSSFSNWIFYRLADIMLMKADAMTQIAIADGNNQEQLKEALEIVDKVRVRSNATETSSFEFLYGLGENSLNGSNVEQFILDEKGRELAFEGKRWFDILHYIQRDNYRNLTYMLQLAIRSTIPEKVSILQNKWMNHKGSHYLPIYTDEIRMNKNLVQNEFYN